MVFTHKGLPSCCGALISDGGSAAEAAPTGGSLTGPATGQPMLARVCSSTTPEPEPLAVDERR
ncbi:hypothetical protein PR003_g32381 [Phytophthora rubi]|uniref:Uncharacterized protein n=1 Tax=Phytophthora rubi TaxID=129364 RepID=A0A6A4B013_9STRA|nr:hypothetical protein PR003_g32381 [Phytophthora rubi]